MNRNDLAINKKGIFLLLVIFCFMYVLNTLIPLLADDYSSAFLWKGMDYLNDTSYGAIKRVSSFADIYAGLKSYYFTWGGRVPGSSPVSFFLWKGKELFNPCNALLFTLLVIEVFWLSHEGRITFDFSPLYIFGIFFALWAFNAQFIDTCLWLAGSCNYLWMLVIVLAFLMPYVRSHFENDAFKNCSRALTIGLFLVGILAGWSHETTNCWIIVVLAYWLYVSYQKGYLQFWKITGFVGFCIGYALLIFAPGNFSRLQMQQHTSRVIIDSSLLNIKLTELFVILFFHFVIWYFIISFVLKYSKQKSNFNYKTTGLYLSLAMSFMMIAFGSGIMIFLLPTNGLRPSFLNLVYLIISLSLLFRIQEVNHFFFIKNDGKLFLKTVGCIYLVVTMFFSLWGNYINSCHLNKILVRVNEESNNLTNTVLEFPPSKAMKTDVWRLGSGLHLAPLPILQDETHAFNKCFSHFYGIKGIRISKE